MVSRWAAAPLEQLQNGSPEGKKWAASALRSLAATNVQHRDAIANGGAIPLLVQLLETGTGEAKAEAAGALRAIAKNSLDFQDQVVAAGGVPPLVGLLLSSDAGVSEQAAGCLKNLAADQQQHRRAIVDAGVIPPLIRAIRAKVLMSTIVVDNVATPSTDMKHAEFIHVIAKHLAHEVGSEVQEKDVMAFLTPTTSVGEAVKTPGMIVYCTIYIGSIYDSAELQKQLRSSSKLRSAIGKSLTKRELAFNSLRPVRVTNLTTPALVKLSLQFAGFDLDRLFEEEELMISFRTRVQLAVAFELGTLVLPEGISVQAKLGSYIVDLVLTHPAKVDAEEVLCYLEKSKDSLGAAVISALRSDGTGECDLLDYQNVRGRGGGVTPKSPKARSLELAPLQELIFDDVDVSVQDPPDLSECTYVRSGTRGAQVQAAGALRNIMWQEKTHQDIVLSEAGIPALVELLPASVPFGDLFSKMDADSSGGITKQELETGLTRLGWLHPIDEIWYELDTDQSEIVTFEEFVDALSGEWAAMQKGDDRTTSKVVRALVTFLSQLFDCSVVQGEAARALRNLCEDNEQAVQKVIEAGAVPIVIDVMKTKNNELREGVGSLLRLLAPTWAANQVDRLRSDSLPDRVEAAHLLRKLAALNTEQRCVAVAAGALGPLIELMKAESGAVVEQAMSALGNIMYKNQEHERLVVSAGAVPYFVKNLTSPSTALQVSAARVTKLCIESEPVSLRRVLDAGGLEKLVELLTLPSTLHKVAISMLVSLMPATESRKIIMQAGFLVALQELATNSEDGETKNLAMETLEAVEMQYGRQR